MPASAAPPVPLVLAVPFLLVAITTGSRLLTGQGGLLPRWADVLLLLLAVAGAVVVAASWLRHRRRSRA